MIKTINLNSSTYYQYTMNGVDITASSKIKLLDTIINYIEIYKIYNNEK